MNCLCHQFLPSAALTLDEHARVGRGDSTDLVVDRLYRLRCPDERSESSEPAEFAAQFIDLFAQITATGDVGQDCLQPLGIQRFRQIVTGSLPEGPDRGLDTGIARDHHHFTCGVRRDVLDQIESESIGKIQIDQHEIRRLLRKVSASACQANP